MTETHPQAPLKRALVSAGLIRAPKGHPHEGRLLVSRRLAGAHLAGAWEFPGGKVELGEDPREALKRELREELDVEVEVGEIYAVGHHAYPSKDVVLMIYECWHVGGEPKALEVASFAWLTPQEVCALPLPPADEELVARLSVECGLTQAPPAPVWGAQEPSVEPSVEPKPIEPKPIELSLEGLEATWRAGEALGALMRRAAFERALGELIDSEPAALEPAALELPTLIAATGDLGAGKTSFAQGLARGLGVSAERYINSPTFSLLQSHPVSLSVAEDERLLELSRAEREALERALCFHHLDLYRLDDEGELLELGFDEVLSEGVGYVEWPARGPSLFERPHLVVALSYPEQGTASRTLKLSLVGLPAEVSAALSRRLHELLSAL